MRSENGMLIVEVQMGEPVYAGRAVPHGELTFDGRQQQWVQIVREPDGQVQARQKRRLVTLMLLGGLAICAATVLGTLAVMRGASPREAGLPVASYGPPDKPVELVTEPFRGPTPAQPEPLPSVPIEQLVEPDAPEVEEPKVKEPPAAKPEPTKAKGPLPKTAKGERAASPQRKEVSEGLPVFAPVAKGSAGKPEPKAEQPFVMVNRLPETLKTDDAPPSLARAVSQPSPPPQASQLRSAVRLVAVMDAETIVVSSPGTGLPATVKVGSRLHDGSTLLSVDPRAGKALTDRGQLHLE